MGYNPTLEVSPMRDCETELKKSAKEKERSFQAAPRFDGIAYFADSDWRICYGFRCAWTYRSG